VSANRRESAGNLLYDGARLEDLYLGVDLGFAGKEGGPTGDFDLLGAGFGLFEMKGGRGLVNRSLKKTESYCRGCHHNYTEDDNPLSPPDGFPVIPEAGLAIVIQDFFSSVCAG